MLDIHNGGVVRCFLTKQKLNSGGAILPPIGYTADTWRQANDELNAVFAKFAACRQEGYTADSREAREPVKELQQHITEHYYTCTEEIFAGLGQLYVADERFKNSIDRHGEGTAEFVSEAIKIYCKR